MGAQPTVLQTADTDNDNGYGPPRRRRRPALSCVECRARKVKCNRERPCAACKKTGSAACTYRPQRGFRLRAPGSPAVLGEEVAVAASLLGGSKAHSELDAGSSAQQEQLPTPFSPPPCRPADQLDEFGQLINRYIAPGLLGGHGHLKLKPLPTAGRLQGVDHLRCCCSCPECPTTAFRSHVLDRLDALERKREEAATTFVAPEAHNVAAAAVKPASASAEASSSGAGQFVKAKFFGQSHWMNAVEPVSKAHLPFSRIARRCVTLLNGNNSTVHWARPTRQQITKHTGMGSTSQQHCMPRLQK